MSSMYDHGLGRRDANYEALTPVDFIARAAEVYGDRLAVVHGKVRRNWRQTYERAQRCRRAGAGRHQARRHRGRHAAEHPGHGRGALRRAHAGRRAQHTEHAAGHAQRAVHAGPWRGPRPHHRHRVRRAGAARPRRIPAPGRDLGARPGRRARRPARRDRLRSLPGRRARHVRLAAAGRRVGRHRAELHVRHHRRSQGRGLSLSRRLPERRQQHP